MWNSSWCFLVLWVSKDSDHPEHMKNTVVSASIWISHGSFATNESGRTLLFYGSASTNTLWTGWPNLVNTLHIHVNVNLKAVSGEVLEMSVFVSLDILMFLYEWHVWWRCENLSGETNPRNLTWVCHYPLYVWHQQGAPDLGGWVCSCASQGWVSYKFSTLHHSSSSALPSCHLGRQVNIRKQW